MNKERRSRIKKLIRELQAHSYDDFESIVAELEDLNDEESDAKDNYPESMQETDVYQIMSDSCDVLQDAIDLASDADVASVPELIATLRQIDGI